MSREEIVKDITADLDLVNRKMVFISKDFGSLVKKTRNFPLKRWYEYTTTAGRHNKWLVLCYAAKRSDWKSPYSLAACLYYAVGGAGAAVITPNGKPLFFSPHFFDRYRERVHIGDEPVMETIRNFIFTHANEYPIIDCARYDFISKDSRYADKYKDCLCIVYNEGIGIVDQKSRTVVTFVSNDMLHVSQKSIVDDSKSFDEMVKGFRSTLTKRELSTKYFSTNP